jgi:ABC-type bacteriocin/lantibiotic exporter with double-glycine peptidase domain
VTKRSAAKGGGRSKLGLRALLPYLRPHRTALIVVAALSLAGTLGTLLQPVLTRSVLDGIGAGAPVGRYVAGLVALLSGGERQRLAIARTLLAGPPVLLLDEPTSNLDARNEAALRAAIDAVARGQGTAGRTMIIVAHRLSTVVDADQIVVLDGGRVVAVGRHDELLVTSPLYRELATHQFLAT